MFFSPGYLGIFLASIVIGGLTQWYIKATYKRFSGVGTASGLTGAQVASKILVANNIAASSGQETGRTSVGIASVGGQLSDHYDPRKGIVALSEGVYGKATISAAAIAAHEVGHAIQTSKRYVWGEIRTAIVPAVNFASSAAGFLIIFGLIINLSGLLWLGIAAYAAAVVFQIVTLPVELNASSRALVQLRDTGILTADELPGAKKVLTAAALTYAGAALISVMNLLYYIGLARR